ncbi:MAG: hypothetical protein AB7H88_20860 [Vicinamibacterales bacterium]
MSVTNVNSPADASQRKDAAGAPKRAWTKPTLNKADIAALTLAGVMAMADAGGLS